VVVESIVEPVVVTVVFEGSALFMLNGTDCGTGWERMLDGFVVHVGKDDCRRRVNGMQLR
jgi:hypothetical protein